jgi:hypothetical protein
MLLHMHAKQTVVGIVSGMKEYLLLVTQTCRGALSRWRLGTNYFGMHGGDILQKHMGNGTLRRHACS